MNYQTILDWAEKHNIDQMLVEELLNELDHEESAE